MLRCPPAPAPPVRKDGLFATAGRPAPDPPPPAAGPFVAIAVGKTNEGESFPAKPVYEYCKHTVVSTWNWLGRTKFRESSTAR
jgi:hypothetical protein